MVCAPTVEVPRGSASARRSWSPRCGRFPENGDTGKGVVEEAADHAGTSFAAACNGGLPHDPHRPQPERDEGGEAQPPGDGDARPSDGQTESRTLDVMPLAFVAPQSSAVDSANGCMEDCGYLADSLTVDGKGGQGSDQLVRDEDATGDGDGRAVGSRLDDGELETEEDVDGKKRWSTSSLNPPPKRRAAPARRRFPPGCGSAAVTGIVLGIGGPSASPMFGRDDTIEKMEDKRGVGGATEANNYKIQESQVVDRVVLDDFAGGQLDCDHPQNVVTNYSPRNDFFEEMDDRAPLHEWTRAPIVAVDGDVRSECEGSVPEGTSKTRPRGLVYVRRNGKRKLKHDNIDKDSLNGSGKESKRGHHVATVQIEEKDDVGLSRRVTRSNMKVKQCMVAHKLKHDGIHKDPLDRSTKESRCGNRLSTDRSKKDKNGAGLVTNTAVLALMAPGTCPWTQGKKSTAGVSQLIPRRNNCLTVREGLCLPDISEGKESIPICVINTIDDMQPMPFKYITKVIYPPSYEKAPPKGCDCTNGCSDSSKCACAVKNEGEIPFNLYSAIVYTKPVIYECGPSCRCPPTCHNRVSQHGPKIQLEIFKTGKTGWGVRSPSFIASGSFICEYVGEVLQETDAERTANDEYLFDIGRDSDDEEEGSQSSTSQIMKEDVGYTIDAAKCGNVGRFINHSCSPNLHAQDVLWDHDDTRVPHVMLFAEKNIRPLQELTYDYNYNIGQVRKNGTEKIKDCFCGSSKCRRRLY